MNPQEDPRFPIIALKGLRTSIAALLCCYQQPVTQTHLCDLLDSSDKTMSKALHCLEEFQIVSHSPEGWSVTVHVTLLGFSLPEWLQTEDESDEPVEKPVDTCPQEKSRKFSDSRAPSSTSSSYLTSVKLEKNLLLELPEQEPETEPELEPESEPEPEPEPKPKNPKKFRECYEAALEAGIWPTKSYKLAEMPHVTPELIKYHIEKVLAEKKEIPLAIYRIEHDRSSRKPRGRKSQDQHDNQRFVTGKYADWINH